MSAARTRLARPRLATITDDEVRAKRETVSSPLLAAPRSHLSVESEAESPRQRGIGMIKQKEKTTWPKKYIKKGNKRNTFLGISGPRGKNVTSAVFFLNVCVAVTGLAPCPNGAPPARECLVSVLVDLRALRARGEQQTGSRPSARRCLCMAMASFFCTRPGRPGVLRRSAAGSAGSAAGGPLPNRPPLGFCMNRFPVAAAAVDVDAVVVVVRGVDCSVNGDAPVRAAAGRATQQWRYTTTATAWPRLSGSGTRPSFVGTRLCSACPSSVRSRYAGRTTVHNRHSGRDVCSIPRCGAAFPVSVRKPQHQQLEARLEGSKARRLCG